MKKILLTLAISVLSLSAFADSHVCVAKKGLVSRYTGITVFDMEPYKKGDFMGRSVYKVVSDSEKLKVVQESVETKLVKTQEEIRELVKKDYVINIGPVRLIETSKYKTVQSAKWDLVKDKTRTEVVEVFDNPSQLSNKYDVVPCNS